MTAEKEFDEDPPSIIKLRDGSTHLQPSAEPGGGMYARHNRPKE